MAPTVTISRRDHAGASRITEGTITMDSTYVNGTGEDVTAAALKLSRLDFLSLAPDDGYVPQATINAAKTSANIRLYFSDNNNAADAALIEAANFDASNVAMRFTARGRP